MEKYTAPLCPGAALRSVPVRRLQNGVWSEMEDVVSLEVPVEVDWSLEGKPAGSFRLWAWPENLEPLALGHAALDLAHPAMRSSRPEDCCGLRHTGQVRLLRDSGPLAFAVDLQPLPEPSRATPPVWSGERLLAAMAEFMSAPGIWDGTGCFHRMGMYDVASGRLVRRAEDIGRHNCLDRLAGFAALNGLEPAAHVLLLSARVTASLYTKARRAGFSFLVSHSAVTVAAVDMALEQDVTLVGFGRDRECRFTVFADKPGRVLR